MSTTAATIRIANDSPFCESRRAMKKLEDDLTSPAAMHATMSEIEQLIRTQSREMLRAMMQAHVDARAAAEVPVEVRGEDGVVRPLGRRGTRTVMTEFGEVEVARNLYQAPGVTARAPLDAALALPTEKYTHEVRRIVAAGSARASFDEVVELLLQQSGAEVPKRQVEELAVRAARDFDAFYQDRLLEPPRSGWQPIGATSASPRRSGVAWTTGPPPSTAPLHHPLPERRGIARRGRPSDSNIGNPSTGVDQAQTPR